MEKLSIGSMLERRGAWLKGESCNVAGALARSSVTRAIGEHYLQFERVRDAVLAPALSDGIRAVESLHELSAAEREMLDLLVVQQLIKGEGATLNVADAFSRRYLSGGWLEELAWLAAIEAGAEEAVYGQVLKWKVEEYTGENEIDLIARRGNRLAFVSCKALRAELDMQDRKQRNRLMEAVHEADNLADHFGRDGERVAVLVTTDLHDELKGAPRYLALMGKAAALDVRLISLERLNWQALVAAIAELWNQQNAERTM